MSTLSLPREIKVDPGSIHQLGKAVLANGGTKPLIIIDSFLAQAPLNLHEKIRSILHHDQLECTFFSDYTGEPTVDHVQDALNLLDQCSADCIVAVGGGSAIDISKAVSFFGWNPEIKWNDIPIQSRLNRMPLIAVPTTAGTGSEATRVMVITDTQAEVKMNPGHDHLIPDVAILDPELTISLPKHFTVFTGLDALTHAIEAYVSNRSTTMTDLYALEAIRMIGKSLPKVYNDGSDLKERQEMILAGCYAGIAFSNSSTNLAHAAGRPLGTRFHIPHGLSVALLLPFVMQFGLETSDDLYADIAVALGADASEDRNKLAQSAVKIVKDYNEQFGIWEAARNYIKNMDDLNKAIPLLVEDALSGNGINTNRKVPSYGDIEKVYTSLSEKLAETTVGT
ncbi:iron-containing alcohol dehydrogenase [Halobacillus shinanisalinarum]|uniref:Iron-containing alcohol dehydrogenase n=1 Tax=Halobacillus shinanisalinarum TaxID=2932258 RepID=A0ABY4GVV5_9BACI|nr:iron-containing alcohol dehydrogenase [Halobacillus shinanisalinarum]UOQ92292.1 iron-containing alcohol dehydrogenase [Halobacillus shinanisalinarum]